MSEPEAEVGSAAEERSQYVAFAKAAEIFREEWGTLQWLVSGPAGLSETMTVGRVTIFRGYANPHHMHPNCDEILYVETGTLSHTLPFGGTVDLGPGDMIVIPKGTWHHATNTGDSDAVVIVAFDSAWRETTGE